jgi:hypothetical protein
MGFWDFVKQLIHFALAAWWNKFTEQERQKNSPDPHSDKYDLEFPRAYTSHYLDPALSDDTRPPYYETTVNRLYADDRPLYHKKKHYPD